MANGDIYRYGVYKSIQIKRNIGAKVSTHNHIDTICLIRTTACFINKRFDNM